MRIEEIETVLALQGIAFKDDGILYCHDYCLSVVPGSYSVTAVLMTPGDNVKARSLTRKARHNTLAWAYDLCQDWPGTILNFKQYEIDPPIRDLRIEAGEDWRVLPGQRLFVGSDFKVAAETTTEAAAPNDLNVLAMQAVHPMFWHEIKGLPKLYAASFKVP